MRLINRLVANFYTPSMRLRCTTIAAYALPKPLRVLYKLVMITVTPSKTLNQDTASSRGR